MGEISFFHPVKTDPKNEIDLKIQSGQKVIAMFKVYNNTDKDWPPGSLLVNNYSGRSEKIELKAHES